MLLFILAAAFLSILFIGSYREASDGAQPKPLLDGKQGGQGNTNAAVLTGHAIAPKLGNATAK